MENMTETKARFFRENPRAEMNFEVVQTEYLKWLEDLARNQLAYNDALQLVSYCDLKDAKIGDKIVFSKVYSQSKRYTVGKEYEFIKTRKDSYYDDLAVRNDRGGLSWIRRNGISYNEYKVISDR